jgi:uncharacterized membrane protein YdbT with pleckstrin-like domain
MSNETTVWAGRTSQWVNFPVFLLWGLLALTVVLIPISIGVILWRYLVVRFQQYELTTERLKLHTGVLSKSTSEIELYRVTDTQFEQPFWLRLVGLAHIQVISSDKTSPITQIRAIAGARELREQLRSLVEARRAIKNVRVSELE